MKHELKVPGVGESIQEVQIGQWLKGEGQWADKDEGLVEIESDKATVDVSAPAAGIVVQVLHRQGDVVPVGTLIGYLEEAPRPDGAGKPAASCAVLDGSDSCEGSGAGVRSNPSVLSTQYSVLARGSAGDCRACAGR